jgi:hypothetical protein
MPILDLNRKCRLTERGLAAIVICAPRTGISRGWLAEIAPNPADPLGMWSRRFLVGEPAVRDDRPVNVFTGFEPGYYEAHSAFRSSMAQSVYFRVTVRNSIMILGGDGDEDLIIARLNRMTVAELHEARAARVEDEPLQLAGTFKQVAWAVSIRRSLVTAAVRAGDPGLAARLGEVNDATWFIANRDRSPGELRERLHAPA